MTITLLFIQGAGRGAHEADRAIADALQKALVGGFKLLFPCMPHEDDPESDAWQRVIAKQAQDSGASVIVAHSAGGAMVADMLAESRANLPQLRSVFLLAPPYVGEEGWDLGSFHLDTHRERPLMLKLALRFYFGEDDETVPADHATLYRQVFPQAVFTRFAGCDHQFAGHVEDVARDIEAAVRR